MEEVNVGESWNKKRVFVAIFLLALLMAGGFYLKIRFFSQPPESVKGVSTEIKITDPAKPNIQEVVKEKIDSVKQQVSSLNISDIASSSPQVQKILNDIKSLQQYPTNQVKEICKKLVENFCGL